MKIFITGVEGYIGKVLAAELIKAGHEVAGLDAGFYNEAWLYGEKSNNYQVIRKDIRQIELEDLQSYDAVVHLAELSNDPLGDLNPEVAVEIGHHGTVKTAELAKQAGVKRFIYSSSCSVYGFTEDIVDEISPLNPLTTYARVKVMNEKSLSKLADEIFSPIILRNGTVYGASPRMRFDLAINNLAGWAWTTKEIKMESDGAPWRPFVHVLDVCEAIQAALSAPREKIHDQIFNVGNPSSNYQIKGIAEIIGRELPGCKVSLNKDNPDKRSYRVNFSKISNQLPGFSSKREAQDGVHELSSIFEKIGLNRETFESRHYTRLKQIKHLQSSGQLDKNLQWMVRQAHHNRSILSKSK